MSKTREVPSLQIKRCDRDVEHSAVDAPRWLAGFVAPTMNANNPDGIFNLLLSL